jgi:uncharacterized GH25 family protein
MRFHFFVLFLLQLCGVCIPNNVFKTNELQAGTPWIKVVNEKGQALASANVEVTPMYVYGRSKHYLTDLEGQVREEPHSYEGKDNFVMVRKDGYAPQGLCHEKLVDRLNSGDAIKIQLEKGHSLGGNVQLGGNPYAKGGNIWVSMPVPGNGHTHHYPFVDKIPVSKTGEFNSSHQYHGKLKLWFEGPDAISLKSLKLTRKEGQVSSGLVIPVVATNTGHLNFKSESGERMDTIEFKLGYHDKKIKTFKKTNHRRQFHFTDENGRWVGPILKKGFYSLEISDERYVRKTILNVPSKELLKVISLKPIQEVKVEVVSKLGQEPLSRAQVTLKYKKKEKTYTSSTSRKTDAKGQAIFRVQDMAEAEGLGAWVNGYLPKKIDKIEDLSTLQRLELEEGQSYRFRFLQPVPYSEPAILSFFQVKGEWESKKGIDYDFDLKTDGQGEIELKGIEDGAEIEFNVDGYVEVETKARHGETVEILLEPNAVLFAVVKDAKGEDIKRNLSFRVNDQYLKDKYISKEGRHKVTGLGAGEHEIRVSCHGYLTQNISVKTQVGIPTEVQIQLDASPFLMVELEGLEGDAPKRIHYQLRQEQGSTRSGTLSLMETQNTSKDRTKGQGAKSSSNKNPDPKHSKDRVPLPKYKLVTEKLWEYHELTVTVEGYVPSQHKIEKADDLVVKVRLKKGLEIRAEVLDEVGVSVKEAEVHVEMKKGRDLEFKTDEKGEVLLRGLEVGSYELEIKKDGYMTLQSTLVLADGRETPRWVLKKGQYLRAKVLKDGGLVSDVEVSLSKSNEWGHFNEYFDRQSHRQKSDADGMVTFGGLGPGDYKFQIRSRDHGMADSDVISMKEDSDVPTVELDLKLGRELQGRVVDADGNGVKDVSFYIYSQMGGGEHQNVKSEVDGYFSLVNLKDKTIYSLQLSGERWEMKGPSPMLIKPDQEELLITVLPMSEVEFEVLTPDGERVEKNVNFYSLTELHGNRRKVRKAEFKKGKWSMTKKALNILHYGNQKMRVAIEAEVDGYNPARSVYMDVDELRGRDHVLQLEEEQSLLFRIRNSVGEALEGVKCSLDQKRGSAPVVSDEKGLVTIKGVQEGELNVEFGKLGYAKERLSLKFEAGLGLSEREVILSQGGSIVGVMLDENGAPAEGYRIWVSGKDPELRINRQEVHSSADGVFRFDNLKEGAYLLQFSKEKNSWSFNQEGQDVDVVDGVETSVELREKSVENAGVLKVVIGEDLRGQFNMVMANSASGGMKQKSVVGQDIVFEDLAEGDYHVTLFGQGGMRNNQVEVKKGETTVLKVTDEGTLKVKAKLLYEDGSPLEMGVAYLVNTNVKSMSAMDGMKAMNGMGMIRMGDLEIAAQKGGRFRLMIQMQQGAMAGQQKDMGEVDVYESGETDLGTFKVSEGFKMKLLIVDEAGLPIKQATSFIQKGEVPLANYNWRSNGDGEAQLAGIPEAPFTLTINKAGYASQRIEVDYLQDQLTVVLKKGFSVSIRVLGTDTISRKVSLRPESAAAFANPYSFRIRGQKTDEQGVAQFQNVNEGRYVLMLAPKENKGEPQITEAFDLYEGIGEVSVPLP